MGKHLMSESEPFEYLRALVFDWAGTTVDFGSRAPAIVFTEIFRRQQIDLTFQQAREPMGMSKRDHIAAITQMPAVAEQWLSKFGRPANDDDIDGMYSEFLPLQKETLASHCDVIEGVPDAVDECRRRGLSIGSSTGYTHELVDAFAHLAADQGYSPDCVVCSDDVAAGRPAPWMLLNAAQQMNVFPLWSIVKVDDTAPGIIAGSNAGTWTIGVTRTGNGVGLTEAEFAAKSTDERCQLIESAGAKLVAAGAQFLIESVADIIPVLEEIDGRLARGERPST
jgi:phosphonoacetaldehyde hydrolase